MNWWVRGLCLRWGWTRERPTVASGIRVGYISWCFHAFHVPRLGNSGVMTKWSVFHGVDISDTYSSSQVVSTAESIIPMHTAAITPAWYVVLRRFVHSRHPFCLRHQDHQDHQDAGGIVRRAEVALLDRISSEFNFPHGQNSASAILPLLAEHMELDLVKDDPATWKAVKAVFERAHPWAVSLS